MLKSVIQSDSNYIKPFKIIFWILFNLFFILPILPLYIIKPILKIQFLNITWIDENNILYIVIKFK